MEEGYIIDQEQMGESYLQYNEEIGLPKANWKKVLLQSDNFIHPSAVIGDKVKMGKGNYVGANCYIVGDTIIGDNNHFEAFCSIGTSPEHKEFFYKKQMKGVSIGNDNVVREFVTINSGTERDTVVKNGCWFLKGAHIGHDSIVEDKVTMGCNVIIAGHTYIMEGATFGLGVVVHQYSVIGAYTMIGMNAVVGRKQSVIPFGVYVGNPIKYARVNEMKTRSLDKDFMEKLKLDYKNLTENKH
jgi:UDP-N-acetylglucosamine acyltransferase